MREHACRDFKKAQEPCTDNEGYGRLLYKLDDGWHIGVDLAPINFCPWCGEELS